MNFIKIQYLLNKIIYFQSFDRYNLLSLLKWIESINFVNHKTHYYLTSNCLNTKTQKLIHHT